MRQVYLPVIATVFLGALAGCLATTPPPVSSGQEDFATYCAACHGTDAKGGGPASATLSKKPPNLTTLSAQNGGTFPGTRVMAKVWGKDGAPAHASDVMPGFGPLLDSTLVPYDGGDGIETPTPVRLVQVAEYLKLLQVP